MNQRLLCGVLLLTAGCGSDQFSNGDGETGGFGGASGASGTAGQTGTGASTAAGGNQTGAGGSSAGGAIQGGGGTGVGTGGSAGGNAGASGSAGASGAGGGGGAAGGAGMAGAGGTGTGGTGAGGAGTGGAPPDTGQSVLERNKHATRDGYFVQPTLTKAVAATLARDTGFTATISGAMWASPLYMESGPSQKGAFFAVTTENNVYALDETTGMTVWTKNLGSSPTANGVACGSIHPLGILSTPVIDATTRTIYVAGAVGTTSISKHVVDAFSVDDGTERPGFPVTVNAKSGSTTFTPPPQNQRSALSLVNGILYVAYGGHVGDCGPYHGWVIGIDTKDPTKTGGWATLGQGEGIWASGGMASDGNGVFAVTGNSTVGAADHMSSDSEQVVRITGLGVLDRTNKNLFFPSRWQAMDSGDQDFGSASPVYIAAGSAHYVAAVSKDGHLYLLDPANLGGMTPLVDFKVANGSNSVHTAVGSYVTAKGTYVMLGTDGNAACPAGGPSGRVVMAVRIDPGSPPKPVTAWCATAGGGVPGPIATSTDGTANAIVWFMSNGQLVGVDGDTGQVVRAGKGGTDACSGVEQWTSPIAAKGRIVTAADGHLCSYSAH